MRDAEAFERARREISTRLAARRRSREGVTTLQPRYDEVYHEGVRWLDSLAGPRVPRLAADVVFTDDEPA